MRTKDEKKCKAIIEASIQTFVNEGFAKASIGKIAKAADVSPATIYIYFDNKEDLINKLYLELRTEMSEIVLDDVHLEGCLENAYKKMWMNYYHYCLNHHDQFNYIMQYANSPYANKNKSETDIMYFNKIYELFRVGKEKGLMKQVSDEILFAYTFYPASQLARRNLCCGSKLCDLGVENACEVAWDAVSAKTSAVACKLMDEDLLDRLMNIFKKGEKKAEYLGVEFEHFLIDVKSLRSYDYYESNGQGDIARKLVEGGWFVAYEENGYLLALEKAGNQISFEPGGQFEISLKPCKTIEEIDAVYKEILDEIQGHLLEDQALISLGYHPKTSIDELPLLPKERYKYMYEHLHKYGPMARNMMKGTASTQVSIDYESEADFIKKYRVANFLSPFIARLFDASPVFEGRLYDDRNLRITIWENTDINRCKLPRGVMDTIYDYRAYASYIAGIKPILMVNKQGIRFTDEMTVSDLSKSYYLSDDELNHATSMVFPDVRLKNFIEIRVADALPYPHSLAVPALIKGIFYDPKTLDYYYEISKMYKDQDIIQMNEALKKTYDFSFTCQHEAISCGDFVHDMMARAETNLGPDALYLSNFRKWIQRHGSYADYLSKLYGQAGFMEALRR